jgi:hypothetical protein
VNAQLANVRFVIEERRAVVNKPWMLADGIDYCDACSNWRPVRIGTLKVEGKIGDLYPDGCPGYYCQECTEKGSYLPIEDQGTL